MSRFIVLDAGPLGKMAHPRPHPDMAKWLFAILATDATLVIPEIADYEVRRSLLLAGLDESVERLNQLKSVFTYLPITTETMMKAAEYWAEARRKHQPTADRQALDGDAILAAQANQIGGIVATENVGHLSLFVDAKHWREIT